MYKPTAVIALLVLCLVVPAFAAYSVSNKGEWSKSWGSELEKLRKQSRTLIGPGAEAKHHAIPFKNREEMEAAWAHLLKVKTKGAPIFLLRGENFFLGDHVKAGVVVHCPPESWATNPDAPAVPMKGVENPRQRWMNATYIELVVDGKIVDLNRLALPANTPIIDERFKAVPEK